jgi:hypothetical protein
VKDGRSGIEVRKEKGGKEGDANTDCWDLLVARNHNKDYNKQRDVLVIPRLVHTTTLC